VSAQLVEKRAAGLLQVTEKLQRSLLDSVSHELRRWVTITGAPLGKISRGWAQPGAQPGGFLLRGS
jgi:hypothetical protein